MLGIKAAVGLLVFMVGLVLVGLSGSRRRAGTWFGPVGAVLTTIGLVVQLVSALGH